MGRRFVPQTTIDRRVAAKDRRVASADRRRARATPPRVAPPTTAVSRAVGAGGSERAPMMLGFYVLADDGKTPRKVDDVCEWARWLESRPRHVAVTWVGKVCVDTLFLGLDYGRATGGIVLWETMVIGGNLDEFLWRYRSFDEAVVGHVTVCDLVGAAEACELVRQATMPTRLEDPNALKGKDRPGPL